MKNVDETMRNVSLNWNPEESAGSTESELDDDEQARPIRKRDQKAMDKNGESSAGPRAAWSDDEH